MHHTCKVLNVPDVSTSILKRLLLYIVGSFDTPEKKFLGENILDFFSYYSFNECWMLPGNIWIHFAGFVLRQNKNQKGEIKAKRSTSGLREQS